jgi:hypothetical protein
MRVAVSLCEHNVLLCGRLAQQLNKCVAGVRTNTGLVLALLTGMLLIPVVRSNVLEAGLTILVSG